MASDSFDRIITSVPANATAGRVMSRGVHWEPEGQMPPGLKHWKAPPPMRAYEVRGASKGNTDLTGNAFGRFKVLGLWAETAGGGEARWVCRCACGDFEVRTARTIKSAMAGLPDQNSLAFQCYYCLSWKQIQHRYKSKGAKPISAFINPAERRIQHQSPEAAIAALTGDYDAAVKIVAHLNRSGFRIMRGEKSGIMPDASPPIPSREPS
jgi:hypothetical protein